MAARAGVLRLYDNAGSTNAIKTRFLLAELGLEYERIVTPIGEAAVRPAGYRAVHPFEMVPALVDGDLTITESNTTLRYLAEREGRPDLRGEDPVRRARIDTLLDSLSLELRPKLWAVEEVAVYGLDAADDERAARVAALDDALERYDALADPDGPYLAGGFSIADCAVAGRLLNLPRLGLDATRHPRLARAYAAATARPAWRACLT